MLCIPFAYAPDHAACGDANAVCAPPAVALANILGACPKAEKNCANDFIQSRLVVQKVRQVTSLLKLVDFGQIAAS